MNDYILSIVTESMNKGEAVADSWAQAELEYFLRIFARELAN
jgi:hypothetical protein